MNIDRSANSRKATVSQTPSTVAPEEVEEGLHIGRQLGIGLAMIFAYERDTCKNRT